MKHNNNPTAPSKQPDDAGGHTHRCAAVAVQVVHFLCELVQQEGADPQDLDPEVVGVLTGRHVHLQMLVRLKAQVWTGNWTTRNSQYWSSITT